MTSKNCLLGLLVLAAGCAKGQAVPDGGGGGDDGSGSGSGGSGSGGMDACSGPTCDSDGDGVTDGTDMCPMTPAGMPVNLVGCADSQLTATLQPFPPFGLTWTSSGDLGRAGGLTWTYVNINRKDLFHIYWVLCDDPATPCGLSLDGPIDQGAEGWTMSVADSDMPSGKVVFTNTTNILLADTTSPQVTGRLSLTMVDGQSVAIPWNDMASLHVTGLAGQYAAEIPGIAYTISAIAEVQDATGAWVPYLDYYDAQSTPDPGTGNDHGRRDDVVRRLVLPRSDAVRYFAAGFTNRSTKRSLVPRRAPATRGESFQSRVSAGLRSTSLSPSRTKPAASTSCLTTSSVDAMERVGHARAGSPPRCGRGCRTRRPGAAPRTAPGSSSRGPPSC